MLDKNVIRDSMIQKKKKKKKKLKIFLKHAMTKNQSMIT
jgi:hypothetical protein